MRSIIAAIQELRDYYANPMRYASNPIKFESYGHEMRASVLIPHFEDVFNFEQLGSGNFSRVYAISDRVVLKITTNSDEAYEAFAEYASRHPSNPWLPKIYYRGCVQGLCFYVLEKLTAVHPYNNTIPKWMLWPEMLSTSLKEGTVEMKDPNAAQLLRDIGHTMNDCGPTNIMMRGDQYVFTDPCS